MLSLYLTNTIIAKTIATFTTKKVKNQIVFYCLY